MTLLARYFISGSRFSNKGSSKNSRTLPGFDGTFYPPGMEIVPKRAAIIQANRYMIDRSDYLIAYAWHPDSNARKMVEYAQQREKRGLVKIAILAEV